VTVLLAAARLAAALALALVLAAPITAQKTRALPRSADGHPDLQGVWTHGTATPFERPVALGTKAFYTVDEAREAALQAVNRRANATPRPGDVGSDNEAFVDGGYVPLPTRQTSLVVEPANGRLPLRPEAEKQRDFNTSSRDTYESMSPWDRCITRGPLMLLPSGYNNGTRIVQSPGFVVIESEMVHEARIVRVDGSPHPPAAARSWAGDQRGHWERDTLVVDSTNFHDRGWVSTHAGSGRLRGIPNSEQLHIVERFTMTDGDTIAYEVRVEDPRIYTEPWKASLLLHRDNAYQMFEYACHEGNQAIELALRGARFEERTAAAPR
jgi:hypothetical protein